MTKTAWGKLGAEGRDGAKPGDDEDGTEAKLDAEERDEPSPAMTKRRDGAQRGDEDWPTGDEARDRAKRGDEDRPTRR
jgi:hypothetical protein